jgi:hypothetical protein
MGESPDLKETKVTLNIHTPGSLSRKRESVLSNFSSKRVEEYNKKLGRKSELEINRK